MTDDAMRCRLRGVAGALLLLCAAPGIAADLPAERLGRVETVPVPYPAHWFWAVDVAFGHFTDGRLILLDADHAQIGRQYRGMVNAAFMPVFTEARKRSELYVAETFYERTNRGKRTDTVTVYDKSTLSPVAGIEVPAKRANTLPTKYGLVLIDDERLLLVYNFTPATSVTVIDVGGRKVLNEIPLPGCALLYPTGKSGFSSVCGNASLITIQLDAEGREAGRQVIEPFFNIETDALFEKPAMIAGVAYFPTFMGNVQEIDLGTERARLGQKWSLVDGTAAGEHWRPGGLQLAGADAAGRFYVLMHRDGKEGSHKDPGQEIWVFDVKQKKLLQRVVLNEPGLSLELTGDAEPLLLVVNIAMNIDVYEAASGAYLRTLANFGQDEPLMLQAVR